MNLKKKLKEKGVQKENELASFCFYFLPTATGVHDIENQCKEQKVDWVDGGDEDEI